jgi:hypothetical protein
MRTQLHLRTPKETEFCRDLFVPLDFYRAMIVAVTFTRYVKKANSLSMFVAERDVIVLSFMGNNHRSISPHPHFPVQTAMKKLHFNVSATIKELALWELSGFAGVFHFFGQKLPSIVLHLKGDLTNAL